MARTSALASSCVLALLCCLAVQSGRAFLPAPGAPQGLRSAASATAVASAAVAASLPGAADAFYYDGKEYFDITFGISPLYWGIA
eukprot:CAMPEP_0171180480 /NCGR_PEP_ID=MMETSP0790-20130122/13777_1 /TAXON_ID=2925 /ORGANISM="Alexandrium catenella, Strain OF101" /LENGTH=84 /DNA_ID=CAMNT_0011645411 /DNA_START=105 /DNA_END=356 /DNA_ORIENTATION=-